MISIHKALLLICFVPLTACATTQAKTKPVERPPLDVPPVPPRVIEPLPSTEPQSIEPVTDLPAAPATPPRPRPQPRDTAKTEPPKPEQKQPEPQPEPTPSAPAPVAPLRPKGAAEGHEAVRQVREVIDRANKMLNGIDVRALSDDRKANYESARDFIKQAEEALKTNNNVFAKSLAERAEKMAQALGGKF